ncbi:nucleoside triphosphate pyrophosphatase [Mechercharimyces sp. CAU 1602]|uniref:Maf family protein n=1 Tax=Mechercharimyces sp. CAU 1602 TaxID=2973933 RepID=UPI0021627650|nr:Maf family protein [Mechercharimyces sp. CAU 1602]MCS1350655.1 Maf family protein [Mechercharimyces sp. CAU 1602]
MNKELVLASGSPRRKELLTQLGLSFRVHTSHVDETIDHSHTSPDIIAKSLASRKVEAVAAEYSDAIVIGADTIVVIDGDILGKPRDAKDATTMLNRLQGRSHQVYTGIAIREVEAHKTVRSIDDIRMTNVHMRMLTPETIASYILTGHPMDKAGSYGIQGLGSVLVDRIEGCYYNVVGLSLPLLDDMFTRLNYPLIQTFGSK